MKQATIIIKCPDNATHTLIARISAAFMDTGIPYEILGISFQDLEEK
jgi:hypothetical protein